MALLTPGISVANQIKKLITMGKYSMTCGLIQHELSNFRHAERGG